MSILWFIMGIIIGSALTVLVLACWVLTRRVVIDSADPDNQTDVTDDEQR